MTVHNLAEYESVTQAGISVAMKAHLVGGGLASMAAAAYLIREAGVPGSDIFIYERGDGPGGGDESFPLTRFEVRALAGAATDEHSLEAPVAKGSHVAGVRVEVEFTLTGEGGDERCHGARDASHGQTLQGTRQANDQRPTTKDHRRNRGGPFMRENGGALHKERT